MKNHLKRAFTITAFVIAASTLFCGNLRAEMVDRIVAVVGGEIITLSELRNFNAQNPKLGREDAMELLIENLLIEQEAKRQGIAISDAEVEARLQNQMAQLGVSEDEFEKMLKSEGVTVDQLKDRIRSQLIKVKFVQTQIRGGIDISEEEILNFYKLNPDMFRAAKEVRLEHIFLPFPISGDMEQREKARKTADELYQRISSGESFEEVAKKYSAGGGDLGWLKPDQMMPSFAKALEGLREGDLSRPFATDRGVHILKISEVKEAEALPLNDVRDRIYSYLYQQRIQEELMRLVGELKERTPIERKL